jgi:hypothetical protein
MVNPINFNGSAPFDREFLQWVPYRSLIDKESIKILVSKSS